MQKTRPHTLDLFADRSRLLWAGDNGSGGTTVHGAGTSILTGGGPGTTPVITKLGINFENGSGHFDCLALMPTPPAGTPGSGSFDNNLLYVTGPITAVSSTIDRLREDQISAAAEVLAHAFQNDLPLA